MIETREHNIIERNKVVINIRNLKKYYNGVKAVDGISFKIYQGECFGFLGPNGAGKTTTINLLSCYLKPDSGDIFIMDLDVKKEPSKVKQFLGIVPQENIFFEELSVYENLMFFGKMYSNDKEKLKNRINFLMKKVGLEENSRTKTAKLSGGMKRRLNLILGLVNDPEILFLDEPTTGLDPQSRRLVWDYIFELKERKKTIFLTTHYMEEADFLSDRLAIIDYGKIIAEGTPEKLKETIGKGDLLNFKVEGNKSNILKVIHSLDSEEVSASLDEIEGDFLVKIKALDGIGKIGDIISCFIDNKIKVLDIDVKRNSLENVFLTLTGRSLRN